MSGDSNRGMHQAPIGGLTPGALYLRCRGRDMQVGQVAVAYSAAAP